MGYRKTNSSQVTVGEEQRLIMDHRLIVSSRRAQSKEQLWAETKSKQILGSKEPTGTSAGEEQRLMMDLVADGKQTGSAEQREVM